MPAALLLLLCVLLWILTPYFLTVSNLLNVLQQTSINAIIAVGMTFVLIIAGIDLSVGSVMALSGAVLGVCMVNFNLPLCISMAACCATGLICGMLNGLVTIKWKLPSFIVTLGMLEAARGAAYMVTDSRTLYIGESIEVIADTSLLGLSVPFMIAVLVVIAGQCLLSLTVFGRYAVAIGSNQEAVRLSGINPRPIKLAIFAMCGLLTAVAAVIHTARLSSANPNAGTGLELQAIAAVVIGGTSLMGGRGSVVSSFFGVLIIAVLGTGLAQVGAQEPTKRLITGCVIVTAVILDYYRHRFSSKSL